jgi:hypothetical protein
MEHDPHEAMLDQIADDYEDLAARHPPRVLAQLLEDKAGALPEGHVERAAWLGHAGETWQLQGDLARARTCFERAVADGGPCWVDPRALLVDVLLEQGESAAADRLLDELRRDAAGPSSLRGPVHEYVGEALEHSGRLHDALRWFNTGLSRDEDADAPDSGLLNGHYRVRRALGLPHDRFDVLCEEHRRAVQAQFDEEYDAPFDTERAMPAPRLTVLYWPPEEFAGATARWPSMRETHGADHGEHRSIVERHLRALAAQGAEVAIGPATVADYLEFAGGRGDEPAESATRAGYAAHLGFTGETVSWPPRRNDRCWCGSGAKYKKCCGALRFDEAPAG